MNGEKARGLIPPRPNLGPEPWPEPAATPWLALALASAAVAALLAARAWRRRRARRGRGAIPTPGASAAADAGPRGRLVGLLESLRDDLAAQFGSSFRARTTEEISADAGLAQHLGDEDFKDLIRFMDRIDRLRFAPERPGDRDDSIDELLTTWAPRVASLQGRIRSSQRRPARGDGNGGRPGRRRGAPGFARDRPAPPEGRGRP